jgi:glycosyltransferase involved in cell wall biosynthesis
MEVELVSAPHLSVVMCAYNEELYIRQAIDSILAQTFTDFELIIVDDASTDQTQSIIKDYSDDRIILLINNDNMGPYRSVNKGIERAQGELLARHDADDISLPDRFEFQIEILSNQPDVGLVSTDFQYIDKTGSLIESVSLPPDHKSLANRLTKGNIFSQGALMFRKHIFNQLGGYREDFPVSQDYDLWLRFSEVTNLINIQKYLYLMRFHCRSISRNKRALQLACKDFAWTQALKRRSGENENPVPPDVLSAFPPDPFKLLLDARGSAYLYYASAEIKQAEESLSRALEIQSQSRINDQNWIEWAMGRALLLADLRNDVQEGAKFLDWFLTQYSHNFDNKLIAKEKARYFVNQAFKGYEKHNKRQVVNCIFRAVTKDMHWLGNHGLWSIFLKSLN